MCLPASESVPHRRHVIGFKAVVDEVLVVEPYDGAEHLGEKLPVEPGVGVCREGAEFIRCVPASGDRGIDVEEVAGCRPD